MIEPKTIEVKLLDDRVIKLRTLTVKERVELIKFLTKEFQSLKSSEEELPTNYLELQSKIVHFIISRSNPKFTLEEAKTLVDAAQIEEIVTFAVKDPFEKLLEAL